MEERLRLLRKSGIMYLCGDYNWLSSDAEIPCGKLVLVADHEYGIWTPSIAVIQDNTEYGMHILQAVEPFSGTFLSWHIWSPLPHFPGNRTMSVGSPWTRTAEKKPERNGFYLTLTSTDEVFVTVRNASTYGESFIYMLSTHLPGSGDLAFADVPVEARFWADLPTYPEPEDED
jgi:hypothetical protein